MSIGTCYGTSVMHQLQLNVRKAEIPHNWAGKTAGNGVKKRRERCKNKYLNYKSYFITHIFLRVRFTHPWWTITCTLYHTYQQSWTSSSATHSKGTTQAKCSTCPSHFVYFDCFLISSVCIITYSCLAGIYYIILKMSWVTSLRVA